MAYDPMMDPEHLEAAHAAKLARDVRPVKNQGHFAFAPGPASLFRELAATLRGAAHPGLSQSQLVELLVWHWKEHPPDSQAVLNFEFATKRGRPRTSS